MSQEQLTSSTGDQPTPTEGIRPSSSSFSKRLVLWLLGVGFVLLLILLIVGVARPSLLKSALANFEPTLPPKTAPLPPASAKISEHPAESSPAIPLQQQAPPSADAQAQNFLTQFEKSAWGATLHDWSSQRPDIPCEPFRGRVW